MVFVRLAAGTVTDSVTAKYACRQPAAGGAGLDAPTGRKRSWSGSPLHPVWHEKGAAPGRSNGERSRHPVPGGSAALTLAWRSVVGVGFALPRDAGLETGGPSRPRASSRLAMRDLAALPRSGADLEVGGHLPSCPQNTQDSLVKRVR